MYFDLARNRPYDICVHTAVCSDFQEVHWISSQAVGGIIEFMADKFRQERHKDVKVGLHAAAAQCCVRALGLHPLNKGLAFRVVLEQSGA